MFPHLVVRCGGLPASVADHFGSSALDEALRGVEDADRRIAKAGETTSDALFKLVGGAPAAKRASLLALRRDLYNGRRPDTDALSQIDLGEARSQVDRLVRLLDLRRAALDQLREVAGRVRARELDALATLAGDPAVEGGLLLSSRDLLEAIRRETARGRLRPRTADGLLRYVLRTALKAVPFGAFCWILHGQLRPQPEHPWTIRDGQPVSVVAPNKALLRTVRPSLQAALLDDLALRLNPTLVEDGQSIAFLAGAGASEVIRRIAVATSVRVVLDEVARSPAPVRELAARVSKRPDVNADTVQAAAFLESLRQNDLLVLDPLDASQDVQWATSLANRLVEHPQGNKFKEVALALRRLASSATQFAAAYGSQRDGILAEADAAASEIVDSASEGAAPRAVLLEDVSFDRSIPIADSQGSRDLADVIAQYVRATHCVAWPRTERETLQAHFEATHGCDDVPLLEFFETYYRAFYRDHVEAIRRRAAGDPVDVGYDLHNPLSLGSIEQLREGHNRLIQLAAGDRTDLGLADIEAALSDVPPPSGPPPSSVALYGELVPGAGMAPECLVATRGYHVGHGKAMSRFLPLLPSTVTDALRTANARSENGSLAELSFDGDFNANLHPPVVPAVLDYPVGKARPGKLPVQVRSLVVFRAQDGALRLRDSTTGTTVLPLDTGLQSWQHRPALHQLLVLLGPEIRFEYPAVEPVSASPSQLRDGVQHMPRLTVDGRLVIRRETWAVSVEQLPLSNNGSLHQLRTLDRWRRDHGLSQTGYVRLRPSREGRIGELGKPQYIDFTSPTIVSAFARSLRKLEPRSRVLFEERFPTPESLPLINETSRVAEVIVQVQL